MKVVITADGAGLEATASPVFGRCQSYVFVRTGSMEVTTLDNPALGAASGAGIQAAQFVVEKGAEAVVTGNVGPNAYSVLEASGVPVFLIEGGTVGDVLEAYEEGELPQAGGATGPAHAGMGRGGGRGQSGGGSGRAIGPDGAAGQSPARVSSLSDEEGEIDELEDLVSALRKQLADVVDRLDKLEEE